MKKIGLLLAICLLLLSTACGNGNMDRIQIMYSASLNGNLDGCTCKLRPKGGLVTRVAFFKKMAPFENRIILDTGDLIDPFPDELMSELIAEEYKKMGYHLIAVGDQDFTNGIPHFLQVRETAPFFSNNITVIDGENRVTLNKEAKVFTMGKTKVHVISINDPSTFSFYKEEIKNNVEVGHMQKSYRDLADTIDTKDILLLVFHGNKENIRAFLDTPRPPDILIFGHQQFKEEYIEDNTLIFSPGSEGNFLGILNLEVKDGNITKWENNFKYFDYFEDEHDPEVKETITNYYKAKRTE